MILVVNDFIPAIVPNYYLYISSNIFISSTYIAYLLLESTTQSCNMADIVLSEDISPFLDTLEPTSDLEKALVKCLKILAADVIAMKGKKEETESEKVEEKGNEEEEGKQLEVGSQEENIEDSKPEPFDGKLQ